MEINERDVIPVDETDYNPRNAIQTSLKHVRERLCPDDRVDMLSAAGTKRKSQYISEEDGDIYGASRFGHFGEYMRRKRAKLQIQNVSVVGTEASSEGKSDIFKGISVYVRLRILLYVLGGNRVNRELDLIR